MRDFLTGLAIVLIIVLTTVLVAPYFVDWTGQREFLEARLGHALGQKVTIGGNIDLKLLPTPYLVLDQVVVGSDDGPVRIGVHHLDLELTIAPLLHGEFDVTEARLEEPTIRLSLAHDRTLPTLPTAPAFQADIRFDKIHVVDGTLAIADPETGHTYVLNHLDLDADAGSLTGPFKVDGSEGASEQRTKFHLATAPPENGRTHTRLAIEETASHPAVEFDGVVAFADAGPEAVRQSFLGKFAASGRLPQIGDDSAPWKLSGLVEADPDHATLVNGELRLGGEDAALTLEADATTTFGEKGEAALTLAAKQLDIDRLAGPPTDTPRPPPRLPDLATLRQFLAAARPSFPVSLDLSVDKATWGTDTLADLQAHVGLGHGTADQLKLDLDLPGDAHLALDGTITNGATPSYEGEASFAAADAHHTAAWLSTIAPAGSAAANAATALRNVEIRSHVVVDARHLASKDLAATFDDTTIKGSGSLDFGDVTRRSHLAADLVAQKLDVDVLPTFASAKTLAAPLDLDVTFDAGLVGGTRLLGRKNGAGGHLHVALSKKGDRLTLHDIRAERLGGATVTGSGSVDPHRASFNATVDAQDPDGIVALLRDGLPGPTIEAIAARADALVPAKTKVAATLTGTDGKYALATLSMTGTLGSTRVDAKLSPPARPGEESPVAVTLDAPESGPLLHQLGLDTLPIDTIGAGRLVLDAKRAADGAFDTHLTGQLGATDVKIDGRFRIGADRPKGSGTLRLESTDIGPLLQTLAFAFPDMTGRIPADLTGQVAISPADVRLSDVSGHVASVAAKGDLQIAAAPGNGPRLTGRLGIAHMTAAGLFGLALGPGHDAAGGVWSREPFGDGLVDPPRSALHLQIGTLDLTQGVTAQNASLDLGIEPGVLKLSQISARVADGSLRGDVTLRRDARQAALESKLAFDGVKIRLPALDASLSGTLDLAGGGASAATLAASLAGSGSAQATAIIVSGADPSAFRQVFNDVEADTLSVDEDAVVRAWTEAAKAPLHVPDRKVDLDLAAGVLHANAGETAAERDRPVTDALDVSYDIGRNRLSLGVNETLTALPKNWTGPLPSIAIKFEGPPNDLKRTIDVGGFLNIVAARALARESARIEAYEFDIRERAFFNTRLQADQRRTAERQKAEDDARKAEAERKARLEAARLERQRKEQAAKAAQDAAKTPPDGNGAPQAPPAGGAAPHPAPPPTPAPDPSTLGRY